MAVKKKKECCGPNHKITWGAILIMLGFAMKYGLDFSEILMVLGIVFIVKGLLWSKCSQ
jgi:hypothetical protein